MGTYCGGSARWKEDRIFTGNDLCYPVELFIHLIEGEAFVYEHEEAQIAGNAWCLVSPSSLGDTEDYSPAGLWKRKYDFSPDISWAQLKADLLDAFGRHSQPYSMAESALLLKSLTRGHVESSRTFLLRVKWVLDNLGDLSGDRLTKLMFLMGLDESELEKVPFFDVEDVDELCELLGREEEESRDEKPDLFENVQDVKMELMDYEPEQEEFVTVGSRKRKRPHKVHENDPEGKPLKESDKLLKLPESSEDEDYEPSDGEASEPEDPEEVKKSVTEAKRSVASSGPRANIHPCNSCDKVFTLKGQLEKHSMTHKEYFCGVCNFSCNGKQEWDDHETKFHLGQCAICKIAINDLKAMRKHHRIAHRRQIQCPDCLKPIMYRDYGRHKCNTQIGEAAKRGLATRDQRKGIRMHVLKEGEDMKSLKIITSHICGVSEGKTVYYCGYCFQQFCTPKDIRLHIHSDHDKKKYRCYICPDYRHNILEWVVEHLYKTHGIKTETYKEVKCSQDDCDFRSMTGGQSALNWHNKTVHSEEYQDSTCKICGKRLTTTCALRTHVEQVHMKIKPFQCDQCPIGFTSQKSLEKHLTEKHGPDGPVNKWQKSAVCNQCGGKYKDQPALDNHIKRMHETVHKPIQCEKCDSVLSNPTSYKLHMRRSHLGHNHLKCPWPGCTLVFKDSAWKAKVHYSAIHKGVKPYGCKMCPGQSWMHSEDVAFHIASKHLNMNVERKRDRQNIRFIIEDPHPALELRELSLDTAFQ